jgi:amino acid permease
MMELNLTCHACIVGFIIHYDLLFILVGIYLYLVFANEILTKLIKSNAQPHPLSLVSLTLLEPQL